MLILAYIDAPSNENLGTEDAEDTNDAEEHYREQLLRALAKIVDYDCSELSNEEMEDLLESARDDEETAVELEEQYPEVSLLLLS